MLAKLVDGNGSATKNLGANKSFFTFLLQYVEQVVRLFLGGNDGTHVSRVTISHKQTHLHWKNIIKQLHLAKYSISWEKRINNVPECFVMVYAFGTFVT